MQKQYAKQIYDEEKVTNKCGVKFEDLFERLESVSQRNGTYDSQLIIKHLSAALNMTNAVNSIVSTRLMCTKLCHTHGIESAMLENLGKYFSTLGLDINDKTLDWNKILFDKKHPYRPSLKLSKRPRSATYLYKDETKVLVQCLIWLKITKPVVDKFNFNITPGQIQSYWAEHYEDLIEFNPKIITMDSPWKNAQYCSYKQFTDYIKYRYDGLCPSEPWFYKKLDGELRHRKFTIQDFDFIMKEIESSTRLSKKYKIRPLDVDLIGEIKFAQPT